MEKRSITGKDILRMDGLLPPTRRLPVCDAVSSGSNKKKDKKWSLGGILKRISSIRDYDSSSNEEEMVYCKKEPRTRTPFRRKADNVILRPVRKNIDQHSNRVNSTTAENVCQSSDTLNVQRDSIHSRSSDGSLEGIGRKIRKNKLKARAEAKRDRICADSSSDEESRKSTNSLTRFQNEDSMYNSQKTNSCNRKSRTARTERYIKRLTKDDNHSPTENINNANDKRNSLDFVNENQWPTIEPNEYRPPIRPRRVFLQSNNHTFPAQKYGENMQESTVGLPKAQIKSSMDLAKYPEDRYIIDLNQNTAYTKPKANYSISSSAVNVNYADQYKPTRNYQPNNQNTCPPEPPPRDSRSRVFAYGCHSFPSNGRYQRIIKYDDSRYPGTNDINGGSRNQLQILPTCDSRNEISWHDSNQKYPRRPLSLNAASTQFCNIKECTNNKHNSTGRHTDELVFSETEAIKCQRRNDRNEQLNLNLKDQDISARRNKPSPICKRNSQESSFTLNEPLERLYVRSPSERLSERASYEYNTPNIHTRNALEDTCKEKKNLEKLEKIRQEEIAKINEQNALERRRSSKNLEEALSELEAIYNSLRLGDDELLDRAERRSMEEFSLKRGKPEDIVTLASLDSSDRTKDDMAYRRMHPKERPTSLSDIVGQSALSNISYLMASPVLTRKDANDYSLNQPNRRDEPDVTRDDVVYRSIHHANNTLKVIDPQPLFGIPLGPVTTATESDYLHTIPTKPDHPRSLYIPQCEPDIVTDDLAYRAFRKDANTTKNVVESKADAVRDPPGTTFGLKKRAVRSLSANLYGLINHDRIHLRREPSLQEITDDINETVINVNSLPERTESFRRVVSDGELSDYDTRWRSKSSLKTNTDINGNHSVSNLNRKKLRVYISPSTKTQTSEKENETDKRAQSCPLSDSALSSKILNDEFWQNCLQPESNELTDTNKTTESDISAYTQLCQDLVNLIKGPNDTEVKPIEKEPVVSAVNRSINTNDPENNSNTVAPSVLHIQSLGSQYTKPNDSNNMTESKESIDNVDIEKLSDSMTNTGKDDDVKTEENTLDFYLRLADENVKLIAEAFSSVADHLRDSHLSQKNSLTSHRSEIENDSTTHEASTRSSIAYSQDDTNDEQSSSVRSIEKSDVVPIDSTTILEGDHEEVKSNSTETEANIDPQLDLSRAVHDLQMAAASLCKHEKEIEELEVRLKKDVNMSLPTVVDRTEDRSMLIGEENSIESEEQEQGRDQEETVITTDVKKQAEEHGPICEAVGQRCCAKRYTIMPSEARDASKRNIDRTSLKRGSGSRVRSYRLWTRLTSSRITPHPRPWKLGS